MTGPRPGLPPIPPPTRATRPGWVVPAFAAVGLLSLGLFAVLALRPTGAAPAPAAAPAPTPAASASVVPSPEPVAEPAPTPSSPAPSGPSEEVAFEGAVLTLPAGWMLVDDAGGTGCVTRVADRCELALVLPDVVRERGGEVEDPRTDADRGWYLGTDVPDCASSRLQVRDLAPIDDKQAEYREWALDCVDEPSRLRMWWLPQTRLAVVDRSDDSVAGEVLTEIVRTADLSELRSG